MCISLLQFSFTFKFQWHTAIDVISTSNYISTFLTGQKSQNKNRKKTLALKIYKQSPIFFIFRKESFSDGSPTAVLLQRPFKKGWKTAKKRFWPALGCAQHPKAGRNTQQVIKFLATYDHKFWSKTKSQKREKVEKEKEREIKCSQINY